MVAVAHGSARPDLGEPVAVRESYDVSYVRLLQGIDHCLVHRADVLSLSLGPVRQLPSAQGDPDPLYVATDVARQCGVPVVVAAGNRGPALDTLQFLARPAWVIAVGATDGQGRLLDSSSRGVPGGPTPAVVSSGVIDTPDPRFPEPSTSWAAPRVAMAAAWTKVLLMVIGHHVQAVLTGQAPAPEIPIPAIGFCDTGFDPDAAGSRPKLAAASLPLIERQRMWYSTALERLEQLGLPVEVRNDAGTVGLAVGLMATPLPQYQPFEAGAGFVSPEQMLGYFTRFVPSSFALLFCDPNQLARIDAGILADLDTELGPLWQSEQCEALRAHVYRGYHTIMVRVY